MNDAEEKIQKDRMDKYHDLKAKLKSAENALIEIRNSPKVIYTGSQDKFGQWVSRTFLINKLTTLRNQIIEELTNL